MNFHLKGRGGGVVTILERGESMFDLFQFGEVVGGQHFALDDGEDDLGLVEPGGVHGGVHHDRVGEPRGEAVGGLGAAVGGAVVDDPEDAFGGLVGFLAHDLLGQSHERLYAAAGCAAAVQAGLVDVVGGEVGQRPAAVVLVLDAHDPTLARGQGGVAAAAGLDGGLLIPQMTYSSSPSGLPSQHPWYRSSTREALALYSGSRMKIQDWYCQGLIVSADSQRRTVEAEMVSTMPRWRVSWAQFGVAPAGQRGVGLSG